MANGELCRHCGAQETDHKYGYRENCGDFDSVVVHNENCPILDCNGDCEKTIAADIAKREELARSQEKGRENQLMPLGGWLVIVDVGS